MRSTLLHGKTARNRSVQTFGVMNEHFQTTALDQSLARWAGACLGGSVLVGLGFLAILVFAADALSTITAHPVAVAATVAAACAFAKSCSVLAQLTRGRTTVDPRRLWLVSLLCNLTIVSIVVAGLGLGLGLAFSLMELMAIALHIVAIANHRAQVDDA